MAVTNYYTVNGKIRGEGTAAGGFRPYGHDALGSVVATYDSTGALQNTYRNAPYGTQVAKTGTAADPRLPYNGGSGYRTTGRNYSPYYVRKRHFDNKTAQWTTVDSMWPVQRPYGYSSSNPALLKDPTGQWPTLSELLAGAKGWISEPINWAGSVAVALHDLWIRHPCQIGRGRWAPSGAWAAHSRNLALGENRYAHFGLNFRLPTKKSFLLGLPRLLPN